MSRCKHEHYRVDRGAKSEGCGVEGCKREAHRQFPADIATCLTCGAQGVYVPSGYGCNEKVWNWKPPHTYRLFETEGT